MWTDDFKRRKLRDIIISVILVILLAGVGVGIYFIYRQTELEDALLSNVQTQQRTEQNVAKQGEIDLIEAEYKKDMDTVEEFLPGIVCWGDSLTAGSSGNISYPYILKKYIDTYICDIYDFRLSIENAEDYSRLDWDTYKVDIPVVNMGAGQEDTNTILGRCGVVPYVTAYDLVIPADTSPVEITLLSENGEPVTPLTGGSGGVNNVTLNGVEGVISIDSNSYKRQAVTKYFFRRLEPGEETEVKAGSTVVTAASELYKDYIHIIWMGTYGGFKARNAPSVDVLVAQTKKMIQRQTKNSDRYLVLGMCSVTGYWDSNYLNLDTLDAAMMQEFGNHYINVRKYLCEDGISDYNLNPTDQDTRDAKDCVVPESFRSTSGVSELNGKAYELIGKLVYERMDRLGYFDEIRNELYIEESFKEILKNEPDYFDRLLRSGTRLLK